MFGAFTHVMAGMWLKRELKAIVSRRNEGGGIANAHSRLPGGCQHDCCTHR